MFTDMPIDLCCKINAPTCYKSPVWASKMRLSWLFVYDCACMTEQAEQDISQVDRCQSKGSAKKDVLAVIKSPSAFFNASTAFSSEHSAWAMTSFTFSASGSAALAGAADFLSSDSGELEERGC